ncbi:hypothetical protein GF369_02200 [Candidatus Peregrinibacteria bacterium]|nr:hypothetical protein [Candidatus Peregrinibacteria bacterium]
MSKHYKEILQSKLKLWDESKRLQEYEPCEEHVRTMQAIFNDIAQTVLDEIDERKTVLQKLLSITTLEEVLDEHYEKEYILINRIIRIVQERALIVEWGGENPHDLFGKLDKDR